jgi:hypothetical protein
VTFSIDAQSIVGKWQLTKQTTCIENELETDESTEDLLNAMRSQGSVSHHIVHFKDNKSGEESTKILFTKKETNSRNFLYKFDGTNLYILDKKSQTIAESYIVEKLEGDSLIISNSSRACDLKMFIRIK